MWGSRLEPHSSSLLCGGGRHQHLGGGWTHQGCRGGGWTRRVGGRGRGRVIVMVVGWYNDGGGSDQMQS
jgi:hypothetical protein